MQIIQIGTSPSQYLSINVIGGETDHFVKAAWTIDDITTELTDDSATSPPIHGSGGEGGYYTGWHHIALVRNSAVGGAPGGVISLFLDGKNVDSTLYGESLNFANERVYIGGTSDDPNPFYGYLTDIRISNTCRYFEKEGQSFALPKKLREPDVDTVLLINPDFDIESGGGNTIKKITMEPLIVAKK